MVLSLLVDQGLLRMWYFNFGFYFRGLVVECKFVYVVQFQLAFALVLIFLLCLVNLGYYVVLGSILHTQFSGMDRFCLLYIVKVVN